MPRPIIKLNDGNKDFFMEWSTIVDAPVTWGMSLEEFTEHYKEEYGAKGLEDLKIRLERVFKTGTSLHSNESVEDFIKVNRAGDKESCLTIAEIIDKYCYNREDSVE